MDNKITLFIKEEALKKLYGWCRAVDRECSGLGIVEIKKDKYVVTEVFMLDQSSSIGYTEIDEESISKFIMNMIKTDNINGEYRARNLKFWWHTHYNFETFWSDTDDINAIKFANNQFAFSMVINQDGDYKARLDMNKPFIKHRIPINVEIWWNKKCSKCKTEISRELFYIQKSLGKKEEECVCLNCLNINNNKWIKVDDTLVTKEIKKEAEEKVGKYEYKPTHYSINNVSVPLYSYLSNNKYKELPFGESKEEIKWNADLYKDISVEDEVDKYGEVCSNCGELFSLDWFDYQVDYLEIKNNSTLCLSCFENIYNLSALISEAIETTTSGVRDAIESIPNTY